MVLLGMTFGDVTFPWSSTTVICLIIFGAVTVGVFFANEWKLAKNPVIPLRLFSSVTKSAPYSVFGCNAFVFIGLAYYLPLYTQAVLGANALQSGLYLLPLIVSTSLAAAAVGVFMQQTGKYIVVMYVAQVTLTLGIGLFIDLKFGESITKLCIFEVIAGIGVGMNIEAPIIAAQAATTIRDTAAVTATMGFIRSLATTIAVVIGGVIFNNEMNKSNPSLVKRIGPELGHLFASDQASANIELIKTLNDTQQIAVRQTYLEALRYVWVMVRRPSLISCTDIHDT